MLFKIKNLIKYNKNLKLLSKSSSTITKMSQEYLAVLKYWFGDDLTQLKSESYTGNNIVI